MRMAKTKEYNEKILTNYKSPFEKAKEFSEEMKQTRSDEQGWKENIKTHFDNTMPNASEQKKNAMVLKTIYEEKYLNHDHEDQHELTFKPDLSKTLASTKKKVYQHTGKWEKSKFEDRYAWSC